MNNYETLKLTVSNPEFINMLIIALVLLFSCAGIRKAEVQNLLTVDQSKQLKGLAIIFIILGHLWVHVVDSLPKILLGGEGVAMFLLLSGYGLTASYKNRGMVPGAYLMARLRRVMIPYWVTTVFLVTLDYFILNRTYSLQDIVMTMLGVNINVTTRYIDYVRWFITFILIWYILFIISFSLFKDRLQYLFLIVCAAIIFPLDYYITHLGFYQIFAFPAGCAISHYYKDINNAFTRRPLFYFLIATIILFGVVLYKYDSSSVSYPYVPTIMIKALDEGISILFCFALIILIGAIGTKGYQSLFLCFLGTISYELFLLHGAFLIKYNPVITRNGQLLPLSFGIFLLCITIMSWIAHRGIVNAYARR